MTASVFEQTLRGGRPDMGLSATQLARLLVADHGCLAPGLVALLWSGRFGGKVPGTIDEEM